MQPGDIKLDATLYGKEIVMQRGVERLNSVQDSRELFFSKRIQDLMAKPNVRKSLSSPNKPNKV